MLASGCSSRATSLLLAIALVTIATVRCTPQKVWDRPIDSLRIDIGEGRWDWLHQIDFGKVRPDEALRIGQDAPYHLGLAFREEELIPQALEMQRLQIERGDPRWHAPAAREVLGMLLEQEQYKAVIENADHFLREIGGDQIRKARIEALYWSERDAEVRSELDRYFPTRQSVEYPELDQELALFDAVTAHRLGLPDWPDRFSSLFTIYSASLVHMRAKRYLELRPEALLELGEETWALIEAKALLVDGRRSEAALALGDVLSAQPRLGREALIRETGHAFLASDKQSTGVAILDGALPSLAGRAALAAQEMSGRLYRSLGRTDRAIAQLEQVRRLTDDDDQRDRVLWYQLDMVSRGSARSALVWLETNVADWSRPAYFDDLVERLTTEMTAAGDTESLTRLFQVLTPADPPSRIRIYYILRRLGVSGLGPPTPQAGVSQDYYRLLLWSLDSSPPLRPETRWRDQGDADDRIGGLLRYGQWSRAEGLWRDSPSGIGQQTREDLAAVLSARGRHRSSIGLIGSNFPWDPQGRHRIAFPRPFRTEIEAAAAKEELDLSLLFALVKEESAFQPAVESHAGAIGLTQLMGETAADEARRMRLDNYDLTSPADNIAIGAHHLGRLLVRLESVPQSLMAYNAGLTRVRRWQSRFPSLPDDLLTEAIPFDETRHYVRKILVSTAAYRKLYEDVDPLQTVAFFYPHLVSP